MKKTYKRTQSGGMLLEMIAVLGLVAVSAPAIYKKNIERTEEIRDMTKASQLRVLKDAAAQYVEKQYDALVREAYDGDNKWAEAVSTSDADKVVKKISVTDLENYLPDGYKDQLDSGVEVYLTAKRDKTEEGKKNRPRGLVSAIVIDNEDVTESRGNRIARMIGVEGGYTMDGNVYGNRGAWSLTPTELGVASIPENRVAVSSTYAKNLSSSDYIYRNKVEGYPEANMMFTDIDMNGSSITHIGRLAMRYNNGDKWATPHVPKDDTDHPELEGSTGGADRDKGLSLLIHGERGEIVGKTRSDAKNIDYQWWNKVRTDGEIDAAATAAADTTHFANKATMELSVGGPTKVGEHDGYLRLRSDDSNACTRIESNYRMPTRGTVSGLTGGGAFVACVNSSDKIDSSVTGENALGGNMGEPTASLVADDKGAGDKGGSGYMIVTNPDNKRKAVIYGNYATSFFNDTYKGKYSGPAMELTNKDDKIVALAAASLDAGEKGAPNGVSRNKEGTVTNLYDEDGYVKMQFRADADGGFIYAYGNTDDSDDIDDYADKPTVAVKGAQEPDGAENESYALVTQRKDRGYAIMQSNYKEDATDIETGVFMVKDETTKNEVAVMGNKKLIGETNAGGYFALKDGSTQDRFRAMGGEKGGAVYMGNSKNNTRLKGDDDNANRTVMVETSHHKGTDDIGGGYMKLSNTGKASLEVTSNKADADDEEGGGMFASKTGNVPTAKIHSNTKGDLGDTGIANTAGGGVALRSGSDNARKAELVTSSVVKSDIADGVQGGTFALKNGGNRNVLVTARGPNNGGWMEISNNGSKGVDFYADYGKGGGVFVSNGNKPLVEFRSGGVVDGNASPVMKVTGSDGAVINAYGSMAEVYGAGGGLQAGTVYMTANKDDSGALSFDKKDGAYGKGGKIDVGSVHINGSGDLEAVDINASARVKAQGTLTVSKDIAGLIVNAESYNGYGGDNIKQMFAKAILGKWSGDSKNKHIGSWVAIETKIGHWACVQTEKNCPNWVYEGEGEGRKLKDCTGVGECLNGHQLGDPPYLGDDKNRTQTWGVWGTAKADIDGGVWFNADPKKHGIVPGRVHDYALYTYGKIENQWGNYDHEADARHGSMYDLDKKSKNWDILYGEDTSNEENNNAKGEFDSHAQGKHWHDNRGPGWCKDFARKDLYCGRRWSRYQHVGEKDEQSGSFFPDGVSRLWNTENANY